MLPSHLHLLLPYCLLSPILIPAKKHRGIKVQREMKVCIYSRVSTGQQDTSNQSAVLSEWAKQRGFEVVKVYEEEESAWKSGHQRVLASLIADTRQRKFQAVLVWALDRLSSEGALAILSLVNKLSSCGVKVLSYQESWTEAPGELAELLYALTGV